MVHKSTPELMGEAFQQALSHWKRQPHEQPDLPPAPHVPKFTVALSRLRGARGSELAAEVGKLLKWPVYDRDLVEKIVEDSGVKAALAETLDERRTSWVTDCLEAFAGAPTMSESQFAFRLAHVLMSLAAHGECIIVGRGAGFLLPEETTLRVGVVAPLAQRVARVQQQEQLTQREAARQVKRIDEQRAAFVVDHFHKDPRDVEQYDLVLNTERLSLKHAAELIAETLRRMQAAAAS